MKACIIYAYPKDSPHGSRLLHVVLNTLEQDGVQYDLIDLYKEEFNPTMPSAESQNWGRDLPEQILAYQQALQSSPSWFLIYPSWWSTPPAILKGFVDRVLTPGFSHEIKNGGVKPLLSAHRALILRTFAYSALQEKKSGSVTKSFMEDAVLRTCGVQSDEIDIYSINDLPKSAFEHTLKYVPGAVRRMLLPPTEIPHHLRSIPAPYLPPVKDKIDELKAIHEQKEKKLSKSSLADLNYFRIERKKARQNIHKRSDRAHATRYRFEDDDSDFHPKGYKYTSRRNSPTEQTSKNPPKKHHKHHGKRRRHR